MFNTIQNCKLNTLVILLSIFMVVSCQKEVTLNFSETLISKAQETTVEVTLPKANGKSKVAEKINKTLTNFACSILNINSANTKKETIEESITAFNDAYKNFNALLIKELAEDFPKWEALIDGEVSYQSESLVSIAANGSIATGSASSNLTFTFFNFDIATGKQLQTADLINDSDAFKSIVKKYYDKELLTTYTSFSQNNSDFKLPETLGFNDDGVIIVYQIQNMPNSEVIEFTIPYTISNQYLNY